MWIFRGYISLPEGTLKFTNLVGSATKMCVFNNEQSKRPGCWGHRTGLQSNMGIPIFHQPFHTISMECVCVCVFYCGVSVRLLP